MATVQLHAPKRVAVHIANPIVAGETLVEKSVRGAEEFWDAFVRAQLIFNEELGLLLHRRSQVLVKLVKKIGIWRDAVHVSDHEPLTGEIVHQRSCGAWIGQHSPHLRLEDSGRTESAALGQIEELVVRNAAPQKERQARAELQVGNLKRLAGRVVP